MCGFLGIEKGFGCYSQSLFLPTQRHRCNKFRTPLYSPVGFCQGFCSENTYFRLFSYCSIIFLTIWPPIEPACFAVKSPL